MHRFVYLKLGLGLVWLGIKLVLQVDVYKMPTWLSLGVVATITTVAIIARLRATRGQPAAPHADPEQPSALSAEDAPQATDSSREALGGSATDAKEQAHG